VLRDAPFRRGRGFDRIRQRRRLGGPKIFADKVVAADKVVSV
jgi:hypothetical protein